jgi:DUF1009 family protein
LPIKTGVFVVLNKNNLGIIAGSGLLPSTIADLHLKQGGQVYIAALEGETDILHITKYQYKQFPIGSVGALLEYFTENNVKEIIIIGGITRPDLKSVKVDKAGSLLIAKILKEKFLGDDNLLKIISDFIEFKGFKVISPKTLLELGTYEKLYVSNKLPSKHDEIDIELGMQVIKSLSDLDIGQSVIAADGYVLGIEAAEGTDALIRRCELLRKTERGGVLVKMAKLTQDMRLDLPTIGPDTIFYLAKHGYNGLAIQKSGVIIVKPLETLSLLNEHDLFIRYI